VASTEQLDQHQFRRKSRDRSIALLIAGLVLLLPPMVGASIIDFRPFGIPFSLVYLFVVWAMLIAGAAYLARHLRAAANSPTTNNLTTNGSVDRQR